MAGAPTREALDLSALDDAVLWLGHVSGILDTVCEVISPEQCGEAPIAAIYGAEGIVHHIIERLRALHDTLLAQRRA